MTKEEYASYLQTDHWRATAEAAKARAGNHCMICNDEGTLHAHHRTYERVGQEAETDVVALCAACHGKFHDKDDRTSAVPEAYRPALKKLLQDTEQRISTVLGRYAATSFLFYGFLHRLGERNGDEDSVDAYLKVAELSGQWPPEDIDMEAHFLVDPLSKALRVE